jgi:hypothetical protein
MTPHTTITLRKESHYGSTFYYVVEPQLADHIKSLTSRKTLTDYDMQALRGLGFTFRLQDEQLPA